MKYPKELAGLRGLAAAYVLVRHALASLPTTFASGALDTNYGVKLFMIVSGFSIFWLLDTKPTTYGRFIVGRAFRIFPAYLAALVVYALLLEFVRQTVSAAPASPMNAFRIVLVDAAQAQMLAHFLIHATLLHGLVPDYILPHAAYTLIGQAWSLTVEWQLYLLAPIAFAWISTLNRQTSQIRLFGLVAMLLWLGKYLAAGFLGNNLVMFSIGIASYAIVKRFRQLDSDGDLQAGIVALVALAAIGMPENLPSVLIWAIVILSATTLKGRLVAALVSRLLCSRATQYIGRRSYSFYLFHMLAVILCLRLIEDFSVSPGLSYILLPASSFTLNVLFAEAAYRWVEEPCHRFGKALTDATKVAPVSAVSSEPTASPLSEDIGRPALAA